MSHGANNKNERLKQEQKEKKLTPSQDEKDQKIKNEPDTERLRSERQSVIDGEQQRKKGNKQ
ncbi:MAG: hypothetical protein M3342_20095 [Bacteroidota bacterium]|nr:hypothetical protein [Flavisolibacter sp.]MDQ3846287.1 hypothetical protein [Bacteroidota bacterium]MBD0289260.1 hypothetical protein [Flavisolibacter sp.]MBD0296931.1 hypothetical protein [Flavisolibacter sp.]MBD0367185.1 hypothetical protein [Flavisolibacter sp.]